MKYLPILLLICANHFCFSQNDFNSIYVKAKAHYKSKEYSEFGALITQALALNPYHQGAMYWSGVAAAINSKPEQAVSFLKQSILIDSRYDLNNPDLASLKDRIDFKNLQVLQEKLNTSVVNSDTAFVIKDRQLHTEGITFNKSDKSFFVGSIHKRKIVRIDENQRASDFVTSPDMSSVFGLKVDHSGKFLWVCTSPMPEMEGYDSTIRSKVFKCDINNRSIVASYEVPKDINGSVFGDMILGKNDEVYVSDGVNNIIFKVNEATKGLDKYLWSPEFANMQGIAFSDDYSQMFISDYVKGIYKLDIKTKNLAKITCATDASLKGIDGLYYYQHKLIAVQNGVFPLRAVKLKLDKKELNVIDITTIDRLHPAFNEPTLGVIDGDMFYYIANSQWGGYNDDHSVKASDQLQDIVILKASLKK